MNHRWIVWGVFVLIMGGYLLMAVKYPFAYIYATYEDMYGEWAQFYFFLAACLFSFKVALRPSKYRAFFSLLGVACLYVLLEEVSWGQRLFGFESPDLFKESNLQGETNLHNFFVGPYDTLLKRAFEYGLCLAFIGYGLLYPLLLRRQFSPAHWLDKKGLAAPPLYLWPMFVVAGVLELKPLAFNEAEVAEILIGFALAGLALHYAYTISRGLPVHEDAQWPAQNAKSLGLRHVALVGAVGVSAIITTEVFHLSPERQIESEGRFDNGVEKFASRYARFGQWDKEALLLHYLHEKYPDDRPLLRRMADAYRSAGDIEQYQAYLDRVLRLDLADYQENPNSEAVNRALALDYRLAGDGAKEEVHLQQALALGIERVQRNPDSASAHYSIGKTYRLMGRDREALEHFTQAYEREPAVEKYKRAYLRAKVRAEDAGEE
ncbi:MAG: tetratricopeptide repeat protein [Pseudomonadota bacterium]